MDDSLRALLDIPGIPGHEEAVRAWIIEQLSSGFVHSVDTMGNLIVGPGDTMFLAHMDEIGFLVSHISEKGFLYLQTVGGFDPRNLFSRRVLVSFSPGPPPRAGGDRSRRGTDLTHSSSTHPALRLNAAGPGSRFGTGSAAEAP